MEDNNEEYGTQPEQIKKLRHSHKIRRHNKDYTARQGVGVQTKELVGLRSRTQ